VYIVLLRSEIALLTFAMTGGRVRRIRSCNSMHYQNALLEKPSYMVGAVNWYTRGVGIFKPSGVVISETHYMDRNCRSLSSSAA
jgi:hypothetical protein